MKEQWSLDRTKADLDNGRSLLEQMNKKLCNYLRTGSRYALLTQR